MKQGVRCFGSIKWDFEGGSGGQIYIRYVYIYMKNFK